MKNTPDTTAISSGKSTQLTDCQINEMENDTLWAVLDQANYPVEASALFSRNVMHEVRSLRKNDEIETSTPSLWQRITSPNFAKIGLGVAAAVVCALIVAKMAPEENTNSDAEFVEISEKTDTDFIKDIPFEKLSAYSSRAGISASEDTFTAEILDIADQDPLYLSEEELVLAMNF